MEIIILGPPGVGKGTQSLLIAQKLNLVHLSTGEILRKAVDAGTGLGMKAKAIMQTGGLVPDDVMIGIVKDTLSSDEVKKGFILDGFPRTLNQAVALDSILTEFHYNDVRVVNLIADKEELIKRLLLRGRKDDTKETIQYRLQVYRAETEPVRDFYSKRCRVYDINGVGDINAINNEIISVLKGTTVRTES